MSRCLAEMSSQPLKRAAQPEDGERQPAKKARDEEQSAELSNDVSEQQTGGDGGNRTHQGRGRLTGSPASLLPSIAQVGLLLSEPWPAVCCSNDHRLTVTGCTPACAAAAASGSSSGSDSVGVSDSKGYVGWLNTVTEIVGHKYPCITRGKYRYHSGKGSELPGYYCCLDAKQSAGTTLSMQRNRHNHYDMNAIEVHGSGGCMLGHLPKVTGFRAFHCCVTSWRVPPQLP